MHCIVGKTYTQQDTGHIFSNVLGYFLQERKKRTYILFLQGLKYVVPFPLAMNICSVKAIDIAKFYIYKKMVTHKNLYSYFAIPRVQYSLLFPSSTHPYPLTLLYFDESFRLKFHSTFSRILTTSATIHIKVHLVSNLHSQMSYGPGCFLA